MYGLYVSVVYMSLTLKLAHAAWSRTVQSQSEVLDVEMRTVAKEGGKEGEREGERERERERSISHVHTSQHSKTHLSCLQVVLLVLKYHTQTDVNLNEASKVGRESENLVECFDGPKRRREEEEENG